MRKYFQFLSPMIAVILIPCGLLYASGVPAQRVRLLDHGINMNNLMDIGNKFNSFIPEDLAKLKQMGIKNVRIVVHIGNLLPGFKTPTLKELSIDKDVITALNTLDKRMEEFNKAGFPMTLSLFLPDQYKKLEVEESKGLMLKAMDVLTGRYAKKYSPDQLFFDVNEPRYEPDAWNKIAPLLVESIRKNAPEHTIIIMPAKFETRNFPELKPLKDSNIIYAMHIYWPSEFTLQGQPGLSKVNPDLRFPDGKVTEEKLEANMKVGIDWAEKNKVPLIMQEFGCSNAAEPKSRLAWIKAVRRLAEKYNLPWTYWSFTGKQFGLKPKVGDAYDPCLLEALSGPAGEKERSKK